MSSSTLSFTLGETDFLNINIEREKFRKVETNIDDISFLKGKPICQYQFLRGELDVGNLGFFFLIRMFTKSISVYMNNEDYIVY